MRMQRRLKLNRYQKTAAAVWACSVILMIIGLFGYYLPQHHQLVSLEKRHRESQEEAELAQKAANEQTQRNLNEQKQTATAQLNAFTIPCDQVSGLVFEVGRIAGQLNLAGFSSKSVSVQSTGKSDIKSLISEAWLSVKFAGSYEQFARFVNLLERNSPAIFVEKVLVQRGTKDISECTFEMELSILMSTGPGDQTPAVAQAGLK